MTIQRMDHVGVVVDDLPAATEFFVRLGLEVEAEFSLEDPMVDRIVGLQGVRTDVAFVRAPDGGARLELIKFRAPEHHADGAHDEANAPGLRHLAFLVEDIDSVVAGLRARGVELIGELAQFGDTYRLCYVRGPEGIIVELAERIA
jgi:catechol 2,3-dioxygenase-like lactoylglutathione lyase family enzyme